jgi:hypothetical protein
MNRAVRPNLGPPTRALSQFILEPWPQITFDCCEEWLVKRVLPRRGMRLSTASLQA